MRTKGYQLLISVARSMKNLKLLPYTMSLCQELTDKTAIILLLSVRKKKNLHTFQLLFINSHKMYNKYRVAVINELLQMSCSNRPKQSKDEQRRVSQITVTNSKGNVMRKMCRICSKAQKKRRDSMWHCETCINKPGLCFEYFDEFRLSI